MNGGGRARRGGAKAAQRIDRNKRTGARSRVPAAGTIETIAWLPDRIVPQTSA